MEVSIEKLKEDYKHYYSDDYKVSIGENQIFTATSFDSSTISKYIEDMKKSHQRSNKNKHGVPFVIGFSADCRYQHTRETPYDILTFCVDSQCLIVMISTIVDPNDHHIPAGKHFPPSLKDLLTDSNTVLVGLGIEKVAKKFEKYYGFQLGKTVDLKSLTIDCLLKDEDEEGKRKRRKVLRQCPLDDLLNEALWRELKIRRETKKIEMWGDSNWYSIHEDRVKHSTLDGFVAWKIGTKYLDLIKTMFLV